MNSRLRITIVDELPARAEMLREALVSAGHEIVGHLRPGDDVVTHVERIEPDVIVVDMDSPDRDTLEGMRTITKHRPRPIVMFTNNDEGDLMQRAVLAGVSAYVVDGLSPKRVIPIVKAAMLRFTLFEEMRRERDEARLALADRKVIERAKGLLMAQRGLAEDAAYRLLRKSAMDKNIKLVTLAHSIVNAADLLS